VLKYGDGSYHPTMAFDGVRATAWRWYIVSAGSFTESWIKYDFEHREIITRYAIVADGEGYPKGWSLGGSNNNSTFTGLSAQSNQLFYGEDTELTFSFSNANAYRWYRLLINAIDVQGMVDPWLSVREVKFFRCETTGALAGDVCTGSGPAHKRPHCMTDASGTYSTFLNGGAR
jgi:hypothetical protein